MPMPAGVKAEDGGSQNHTCFGKCSSFFFFPAFAIAVRTLGLPLGLNPCLQNFASISVAFRATLGGEAELRLGRASPDALFTWRRPLSWSWRGRGGQWGGRSPVCLCSAVGAWQRRRAGWQLARASGCSSSCSPVPCTAPLISYIWVFQG